jgi:hypothetical protein
MYFFLVFETAVMKFLHIKIKKTPDNYLDDNQILNTFRKK